MPPASDASSGSLTGPPLWTLTAVVIVVAGLLFYFVSEPLASAFDLLLPSSLIEGDAPTEEPTPILVDTEPEEPPPPPPRIWTAAEIEAGMADVGATAAALIDAGRSELPTYEDLGSSGDDATSQANAQRAAARWARWGAVWHNRVEAERAKMPPRRQCQDHEDLREACVEVHDILDEVEAVSQATSYDDAETRFEAATERLDLYLTPPPDESADGDSGSEDGST